ncbi:MAG: GNAT family N-acetyltransferase [Candidatus Methanofastidiosia archaeon]
MEYKLLKSESIKTIYNCFLEAFSDYTVDMQLPFEKFQRMITRNNVNLKYSIGLYHKDTLTGFILNGVGTWNGVPTVYDSGTGIIKEFRGKNYSTVMLQKVKQYIQKDFQQYLLEVIQTNTPAFTLYNNQGFNIQRELACFYADKAKINTKSNPDIAVNPLALEWDILQSFWNFRPSWQNSIPAVERMSEYFEALGAFIHKTCVGYVLFDPVSGEIIHIAVKKNMRRKNIGSHLLSVISDKTKSKTLRIVNVDKNDHDTMHFFKDNNFVNDVNQYEMILPLNPND